MFAALIPIVLQNLPAILKVGQEGFAFIAKLREAGRQSGEWTADHEAQFVAGINLDAQSPEWQPDPK